MLDNKRINPFLIVIASFLGTALLGSLILMQPWATQAGVTTKFLDAFLLPVQQFL